jgi:hypothetical protein
MDQLRAKVALSVVTATLVAVALTGAATQRAEPATEARLDGGAVTRDSLVAAFVHAVEHNDRPALERMVLSRVEFDRVYYPNSAQSRPPYELEPDLMWMQISAHREKGLARLLENAGGRSLGFVGYECTAPVREREIELSRLCQVTRIETAHDTTTEVLFGSIIGYRGVYKFVGYVNGL